MMGPSGPMPLGGMRPPMRRSPMGPVKPTFDPVLCEPVWPRATELDDKDFSEALLKRNQDLSPTSTEQAAVLALVTKITNALEKLIVAPDLFDAAGVEEVRPVGSYKKGTMITKSNIADLVVVLRTLPTVEAVTALGQRVVDDVKKDSREMLGAVPKEFGCEIAGTQAVVRLLVTTLPANMPMLDKDLHLDAMLVARHQAAIRHARWFDENANQSTVRVLVRLLKDLRRRFAGFKVLNVWALELLAHYCVMNTPNRTALPINQAFRRVLQLLAAGLFLVGSAGLIDPCEPGVRLHHVIKYEDQDLVCSTAQTLLRVLCHGGYKQVLGLLGNSSLCLEMSVWDGIVVTPLDRAYDEKEMFPDAEDSEQNADKMDTQSAT